MGPQPARVRRSCGVKEEDGDEEELKLEGEAVSPSLTNKEAKSFDIWNKENEGDDKVKTRKRKESPRLKEGLFILKVKDFV